MVWTKQATLQGPQGPAGPQGPVGPEGPPGPAGSTYTDEQAQDAVASILVDSLTINFTYDDITPTIGAQIKNFSLSTLLYAYNSVLFDRIQQITDGRLLGRSAGSAGTMHELTVGTGLTLAGGVLSATTTYEEGSFTVTATGMTTAVTGTAYWVRVGARVDVQLPQLSGTSNAETMTLTGLPGALQPTQPAEQVVTVQDAGLTREGRLSLAAGSSTMTVYPNVVGNSWTTSGTKRLMATVVSYVRL